MKSQAHNKAGGLLFSIAIHMIFVWQVCEFGIAKQLAPPPPIEVDVVHSRATVAQPQLPPKTISKEKIRRTTPKPLKAITHKRSEAPDRQQSAVGTQKSNSVNPNQMASKPSKTVRTYTDQELQYRNRLFQLIKRHKVYPRRARRMNRQGRVTIQFTLDPSGQVVSKKIVEPSAHQSLNSAALKLIDRISGRLPYPNSFQRNQWVFVLPIDYELL